MSSSHGFDMTFHPSARVAGMKDTHPTIAGPPRPGTTPPVGIDPQPGDVWGDVEFGELVGRGSMGAVYRGFQVGLGRRPVAIKVLPSHLGGDAHLRERFQIEAATVARIASPHVVSMYTGGIQQGTLYFVMEFVEGEDLATRLERLLGKLDLRSALEFGRQAALGLATAHQLGIIHRDIKPANMMVSKDGTLKLTDFGLARLAAGTQGLTISGTVMGTVSYFSPEQARGERCEGSTDIYALGVSLYEMLTGCLPFSGENPQALIYQHLNSSPAPLRTHNPEIPEDVQAVVFKCLQKLPSQRYSAQALAEDLARLLAGKTPALPSPELKMLRRGQMLGAAQTGGGISPAILAVAGIALVAGTAGVVWGLTRSAPAPLPAPAAPTVPAEAAKSPTVDPTAIDRAIAGQRFDEARSLVARGRAASPTDPIWDTRDRLINTAEADSKAQAAEAARRAAEATARQAAETEARRLASEQAAAEAKRLADEAAKTAARQAAEAEAKRIADEAALAAARQAAEAEAKRIADEAALAAARKAAEIEAKRIADEQAAAAAKRAADEAAKTAARQAAEAEARRIADEEAARKLAAERAAEAAAAAARKAAAEDAARQAAESAARKATDEAAARKAADEAAARKATDEAARQAATAIAVAASPVGDSPRSALTALDAAVVAGNGAAIAAAVTDPAYAAKLGKLATYPGLVFDSRIADLSEHGDTASATVAITHALASYPKRTLNYRYDLSRRDGRWVITTATRLP